VARDWRRKRCGYFLVVWLEAISSSIEWLIILLLILLNEIQKWVLILIRLVRILKASGVLIVRYFLDRHIAFTVNAV